MTTTNIHEHIASSNAQQPKVALPALTLAALGVVYGDIGTSPLYAIKEIFSPSTGVALVTDQVIGAVSVVFWAIMLVVTLKYVLLILRADNKGEGGILALTALAVTAARDKPRFRTMLMVMGMMGATLFYGDSVITPAISVLGAIEGLEVATPHLKSYIIPATLLIMIGLFSIQRFGTGLVGKAFGPIIIVWFVTIGAAGAFQIAKEPGILQALNPVHAASFLVQRGWHLFATVGAIALVLTGAEALYADMGHFGRRPIQIAWNVFVLPSLLLNYFGQGALLIRDPGALDNPFYRLFPESMLLYAVVLSTLATIIASQAVISGAFSMTKQAMQLGLLPRMNVLYTSSSEIGQIYVPVVNWILFGSVLVAVLTFGSSAALAGAYGIAVTLTMMITTLLTYVVIREAWHFPSALSLGATGFFLCVDLLLVMGCSSKLLEGGWFPLLIGATLFITMETWQRGRSLVASAIRDEGIDLAGFVRGIDDHQTRRAERTAIYAVGNMDTVPQALLHNLKHNQVLHRRNIILTVAFREVPRVAPDERIEAKRLSETFWCVRLHFGFMDTPDVPKALKLCDDQALIIDEQNTSYFLSRQTVIPSREGEMSWWRENLFSVLHRNASSVASYFKLPENCVVELGTHVQI